MEPLTILAIAKAASEFVPGIARWLSGERAGQVAEQVVQGIQQVTGIADPQQAVDALRANSELQVKLRQILADVLIAEYEHETRRLESVNATMRAEAASCDAYTRRWRPTLGYVVTASWGAQMLALTYLILVNADKAVTVMTAMAGLSMMWSIALGVLGVGVSARSRDKQVAAGHEPPPSLLGALASRIAG